MSDVELKPCPHCGNSNISIYTVSARYIIECQQCFASCGIHTDKERVIAAWNRRTYELARHGDDMGWRDNNSAADRDALRDKLETWAAEEKNVVVTLIDGVRWCILCHVTNGHPSWCLHLAAKALTDDA